MLDNIGVGSEACSRCGEKTITIYFYNKPVGDLVCAGCLLKEAESVKAKLPQLEPGRFYWIRVNAYKEARYEGSHDEVSVEFMSRFVRWFMDGEEEYAIFVNGVKIGPRSNLGVTWSAS